MANDELAEIDGIKPNVLIQEGEEKEVKSKTSDSKYKVKRTADHFYCTCPAWRNQSRVPVNARSCKHLMSLLGEKYEEARLELKNPGGPPPKGYPVRKAKNPTADKPASAKGRAKVSTKQEDEDMDVDVDMEDAEERKKPLSKRKAPAKRKRAAESEEDEEDKPKSKNTGKPPSSKGKAPAKKAKKDVSDTEEDPDEEIKPKSRKPPSSKGKAPARKPTRRPKDVSETEDDFDDEEEKPKSKKPASSKSRPPAKQSSKRARKDVSETEDDSEEEVEVVKKPSTSKKPSSKPKTPAKRQKVEEEEEEEEAEEEESEGNADEDDEGGSGGDDGDELASINGIRPDVYMKDGDETEVKSQTSSSVYKVKRTWDHYYCTCPAWRNQAAVPVNARSCKHLQSLLGEKYEAARVKLKNPDGADLKSPKKKAQKKKAKKGDDDDDDDGGTIKVEVLLANTWDADKSPDPKGWWISEKLDGVRTYYDGKNMYSRLGNPFTPPQWFLDKLPKDVTLDGELFGGRGEFQSTVSIVKTMNSPHWKNITFHVFDIPSSAEDPFESRMKQLDAFFAPGSGSHVSDKVVLVEQEKAKNRQHVIDKLKEVESLGGEGLMLREPGSKYVGKRSSTLLKFKSFYDAEAIVTGYKTGKGRNSSVTGALKCKMASGKTFDVGTGLNDKTRKNPPKIGSIIKYKFQELTRDGVPRFPSYQGESDHQTKPEDAVIPDHRKGVVKK